MLSADIPTDVWNVISYYTTVPKQHIRLSHVCQSSRAVYASEERWKQICRSMGLGRPNQEEKTEWKNVFWQSIRHKRFCRVPQCYQYGAPSMDMVGDLLPNPEAVKEHYQFFKDAAKASSGCSCPECRESDDENSFTESDDEDDSEDADDEDDDSDNMDDSEDDEDDDDEDDEESPAATLANMNPMTMFPNAIDPVMAALLDSSFMDFMGPPPGPLPFLDPFGYSNFPPTGSALQAGKVLKGGGKSKDQKPKIRGNVLPLSWKNRSGVPKLPMLHEYLRETGSVPFFLFLNGHMLLQPPPDHIHLVMPKGMDWSDDVDPKTGVERNNDMTKLFYHSILGRAFATNPPVTSLSIKIDIFEITINNPNGVTVKDFVYGLGDHLFKKDFTAEEIKNICAHYPHPNCSIDRLRNRLVHVFRDQRETIPVKGFKSQVRDTWYRGVVKLDDGKVCIAFHTY